MARATLQQIADEVGIHRSAVSRVLTGKAREGGISENRAKVVRQVARRLGYRPNALARGIATGRFGSVALLLSADAKGRSSLPPLLLRGIVDALEARGLHLTMAILPDARLTDDRFVPKLLREWTSDGLLINYNKHVPPRLAEIVEDYHFPSVWVNAKRDHDCVYPDDLGAGRQATERLLHAGHRRITYVSFSYVPEDLHYSDVDRYEGYVQVMRQAGLTPCMIHRGSPGAVEDSNCAWSRALSLVLSGEERPTALIAYSPADMLPIYRAAERTGIEIPSELSLVAFGSEPIGREELVATALIPDLEVGRRAVEMLSDRIGNHAKTFPPEAIPFGFDEGRTICPPPATRSA